MKNSSVSQGPPGRVLTEKAGGTTEKEKLGGVCVCRREGEIQRETERKKVKRLSLYSREVTSRRRRAILKKVKLHE